MTTDSEEEFLGEESHLVPSVEPGQYCNAKKTVTVKYDEWSDSTRHIDPEILAKIKEKNDVEARKGDSENRTYFKGYCGNGAGKGTDHRGAGRCKFHGGESTGPPAHNQNGTTTGLKVDPHHYHENLDPAEQEWIKNTTNSILNRVRRIHGRDPDFLDQTLARSIAINFHILSHARDYSKDEMVQVIIHGESGESHEEKGALVEEIRRFQNSLFDNLKKLGVLEDPESQKAEQMGGWREFMESGSDDDTVINAESHEVEE
jgi:hypothetical protein